MSTEHTFGRLTTRVIRATIEGLTAIVVGVLIGMIAAQLTILSNIIIW